MICADCTHIVWDWNGTLLNDVDIALGVTNQMLSERGLPQLTVQSYREVFGFPIREYYEKIGFDCTGFDQLAHEFVSRFYAQASRFRLYPEVTAVLNAAAERGMTQSILSASREQELRLVVDQLRITNYFCSIDGLSDNYAHSKVERGVLSLERLGVDPARTVLIGDTAHDSEVAGAMGSRCLLIANGHQSRARLTQRSEVVAENLAQVRSWIISSCNRG